VPLATEEDVLRAICTDKWDGERLSPSLFKGTDTSVSRLALISLADHWEIFRRNVQKPPERMLALIGEINIGDLQELGQTRETPVELSVEADPLDWNRAHAIIPQNITRGLANRIVRALKIHEEADSA
jgi:hypothetical protein